MKNDIRLPVNNTLQLLPAMLSLSPLCSQKRMISFDRDCALCTGLGVQYNSYVALYVGYALTYCSA